MQKAKIFISHAKEDNHVVSRILRILDDYGIRKFVDLKQLDDKIGPSINESINDEISTSNYFLLVWSKHAAVSKFVKKEYNNAISPDYDMQLEKIIIRLDDTQLPFLLSDIKFHRITDEELEPTLEKIVQKIKKKDDGDDERKFDAYLYEMYGKITIVERQYDTASAFKTIDRDSYDKELEKWKYYSE